MKSNKLLWINGMAAIVGGMIIFYASLNRWHWEIIYSVPTLVENAGWGDMVILTSWLFWDFLSSECITIATTQESIRRVMSFYSAPLLWAFSLFCLLFQSFCLSSQEFYIFEICQNLRAMKKLIDKCDD